MDNGEQTLRIVLIRPGATDFDSQGRIQGTLDIPLNDRGGHEVSDLVEQVRACNIGTLYYSDCESARQTVEQLSSQLGAKTKKLEKMQNLDHGLWQGKCVDEVKRNQPKVYRKWQEQPESVRPPGGEMLADAQDRVAAAMKKLLKKNKQGTIGLVIPEPLASLVRQYLNNTELGDLWAATEGHGRWEVIDVQPRRLIHS